MKKIIVIGGGPGGYVAAIRAAEGAQQPFDILPAVWLSSAVSVAVGLTAAYLMQRAAK